MADNNLPDDFVRALLEAEEALRGARIAQDDLTAQENSARMAALARQKKLDDELDESIKKWSNLGNKINSVASSMTSPEGAFKTMGDLTGNLISSISSLASSIPVVGGFIAGLGKAAGETVKFLTDQTQKAFNTFNKISGSGVVSSFEGLRLAGQKTGLSFEEVNNVLSKHSESLALFRGSALDGSLSMQQILEANKQFAENLQELGVDLQEFSDIQAGYVAYQVKTGMARGKENWQLAEEAKKYAEEIVEVSRLTGKSREEQQKIRDELLRDARYRAALVEFNKKGLTKQAKNFETTMRIIPDYLRAGYKDFVAAGGVATTKAAREMVMTMTLGGENPYDMYKQQLREDFNPAEIQDRMNKASLTMITKTVQFARQFGAEGITANYVGAADAAALAGYKISEINADIKKDVESQKDKPGEAAKAMTTARRVSNQMQTLATNTNRLTWWIGQMGNAMETFIGTLNDVTGARSTGSAITNNPITRAIGQVSALFGVGAGPDVTQESRIARPDVENYMTMDNPALTTPLDSLDILDAPLRGAAFPARNIPGHARGALVQPTAGGTLVRVAEGGQPEAIVPLPDGRSIPVIIKNTDEHVGAMGEIVSTLSYKMEMIIDLLGKGAKYNREIAQNVA